MESQITPEVGKWYVDKSGEYQIRVDRVNNYKDPDQQDLSRVKYAAYRGVNGRLNSVGDFETSFPNFWAFVDHEIDKPEEYHGDQEG